MKRNIHTKRLSAIIYAVIHADGKSAEDTSPTNHHFRSLKKITLLNNWFCGCDTAEPTVGWWSISINSPSRSGVFHTVRIYFPSILSRTPPRCWLCLLKLQLGLAACFHWDSRTKEMAVGKKVKDKIKRTHKSHFTHAFPAKRHVSFRLMWWAAQQRGVWEKTTIQWKSLFGFHCLIMKD